MNNNFVFVIDLDGTLLNNNKEISRETILELKKHQIILASGRHYDEITPFIKQIGSSVSYVISCDGAYIHDSHGNLLFINELLDSREAAEIYNGLKKKKMTIICDKYNCFVSGSLLNKIMRRHQFNDAISKIGSGKIEKIRISSKDIADKYIDLLSGKYSIHKIFGQYIDIKSCCTNKYYAIKKLCELRKFSMNDVVFFGDDDNDVECFDNIKHCVAMGNALPILKEKAEYVTKTNNEDGVLYAIINRYNEQK